MLNTLFGKKKLTEDKMANVFVNALVNAVETSFGDVATAIRVDKEFVKTPFILDSDSDKFLMICVAGNLSYLPRYFSNNEEMVLKGKITEKLGKVFGLTYGEMKDILSEYNDVLYRVNYPSKNTLYGMSKAVFYKYELGQYQDAYFAELNAPNPIFLKKMDGIMENYLWNWSTFFDKYKFAPTEA